MEHADAKDLTLRLFRDLLGEDEFADLDAGIVIQAYLRDSRDDLADLIAWSAQRSKPITVRLVKGAYWDTETVHAKAAGWPVPVFEHKDETDANYERCARLLQDHHGAVRAAFAQPQPALPRLRDHLRAQPRHPRHRLRDPDALRHGRADARGHPPPRPAPPRVRAGRRAGPRHGVPGAPAAREHVQRVLRPAPLRRRRGPRRPDRGAEGGRHPGADLASPAPAHRRRRPVPVRARAACGSGGGGRPAPPSRSRSSGPTEPSPSRSRPSSTATACAPSGHDRIGRPRPLGPRRRDLGGVRRRPCRRRGRRGPGPGRPLAVDPGPRTRRRPVRRGRVDAGPTRRAGRARGVRGRQALGAGRRRRLRGDRLLRVLRPRDAAARRRRRGAVAARARRTRSATRARASAWSSRHGTSRSPSRPG